MTAQGNINDEVWTRLTRAFPKILRDQLTPANVASVLRTLGQPVSDPIVLAVYEQLRAWYAMPDQPEEVARAQAFLTDHEMYIEWKRTVARGDTLGGFFEWREQQS